MASDERVGVLVIRIWLEPSDEARPGFRARLTRTDDVVTGEHTVLAAASAEEVVRLVADWLDEFLAAGDGTVTGA